ncbi:hypothetical protein MRB53_037573 [Persea americana]|nr:hypothetical protein MRB53_037573 [Persea americana]
MDQILDGLNSAQRAAVTSPAAVVQVLAPPGSGKTKTLTSRVAYLITQNGLEPRNIVVCTFTIKAAREMQERIRGLLGSDTANRLVLGTFHSIARRFLVRYGSRIGIKSNFGIADTSDSTAIVNRIVKRLHLTIEPKQARARISKAKAQCVSCAEFAVKHQGANMQEFSAVYAEYEDHLRVSNLLDYDDLLLRCADLLRRFPECVARIEAVLIDEFQDTNTVQYDLMVLLAQQRNVVTSVGDPDQSIYGWRSAEVKNLQRMVDLWPETHVAKLEENYRSSALILNLASELIQQDTSRPAKALEATLPMGPQPVLRQIPSAKIEALWIVGEVQRVIRRTCGMIGLGDVAILLRSASLSRLVESALGRAGVPYRMVGGNKFFDRIEIKLVLDYLRAIENSNHNEAVARIINVPSRKIGDATVARLLEDADARRLPLWKIILEIVRGETKVTDKVSPQAQRGLEAFVNVILSARKRLTTMSSEKKSLADFITFVVQKAGIQDHLKRTKAEDFDNRWANVQELVAQATDIVETAPGESLETSTEVIDHESPSPFQDETVLETALTTLLANVALSAESSAQASDQKGLVTLSTIHAAKGLEWPIVFIPAVVEGIIPHSRAEDTDEERRLLYVAMTRAKAFLYLSIPSRGSTGDATSMSTFLSSKALKPLLANAGSQLGSREIKEIALILRRECPTERALSVAAAAEDAQDNRWLSHEDESESWNDDEDHAYAVGHRQSTSNGRSCMIYQSRQGLPDQNVDSQYGCKPTMMNQKEFTSAAAAFSTKFVSASTLQQTSENTPIGEGARDRPSKKNKSASSQSVQSQGSITSFFGKPTVPTSGLASDRPHKLLSRAPLGVIQNPPRATESKRDAEAFIESKPLSKPITLHTTSMQRIESHRKTLGVKRSFNGWESRQHR